MQIRNCDFLLKIYSSIDEYYLEFLESLYYTRTDTHSKLKCDFSEREKTYYEHNKRNQLESNESKALKKPPKVLLFCGSTYLPATLKVWSLISSHLHLCSFKTII